MYNKVEISGINTSKLPLLNKSEKEKLLIKIKDGDYESRNTFINSNLRLVLSIIKKFYGRGESADDLFQIGCVGLIKAIDNFNLNQNVQFSTYAVPMIIGEVKRFLRDNNTIRVSRSIRDLAYKVIQCKEQYLKEKGIEPQIEDIAKKLEVKVEDISMCLDAILDPISLQEPINNNNFENICIMDQISDTVNTEDLWSDNLTLQIAIDKLNEKEKKIISKRFFNGRTQIEVAEEIGISQAQVSRLEKNALLKIKNKYI